MTGGGTPGFAGTAGAGRTITTEGLRIRANLVTGTIGLIAVMVALVIVALFGSQDAVSGPSGSSFVTTPQGTAALYETLERLGADVERSRSPLDAASLGEGATLMLLDIGGAAYGASELDAVTSVVAGGGTVVMAGRPSGAVLDRLDLDVEWSASTALSGTTDAGERIVAGRFGVFRPPGSEDAEAVVAAGENSLVLRIDREPGAVFLVADAAILSNANLVANAEFAVGLTGTGRVVFDELRHGFGEGGETGLTAAMSDEWRRTLWLLAAAGAVTLVVYGRRFGPPEPEGRDLVPSRAQLIESVAMSLRRTGDPVGATAPVRAASLAEIRRQSALGPDAGDDEVRAATARMLPPDEVDAIFEPTPDTVLTADRALARLQSHPPSRWDEDVR